MAIAAWASRTWFRPSGRPISGGIHTRASLRRVGVELDALDVGRTDLRERALEAQRLGLELHLVLQVLERLQRDADGQFNLAGKTALATALAVEMGAVVLDLDPQTSACRWRDRREAAFPVVTDVAPARLRPTLDAARARRVATVVLDTPPRPTW